MSAPILDLLDLGFAWPGQPELLDIPAFRLAIGERLLLAGRSGSGKTTLLGLLAGVQRPTRGRLQLLGQPLDSLPARARDRLRADHCGFIFQQFNLLPFLSMRANVELACQFSTRRHQQACARHGSVGAAAGRLLEQLGLPARLHGQPAGALSIGQQQRVAAARALIGQPELVIADEPTSALDAEARTAFLDLLFSECSAAGASLLLVSHDRSLAPHFDRALNLADLNRARPAQGD